MTQQLARPTPEQLAHCRLSVEAVDDLCSFRLLAPADHLELDWSPLPLELAAAEVSEELRLAVQEACAGGDEINAAYRAVPNAIWEQPVRALSEAAAASVATKLASTTGAELVARLPVDAATAREKVALTTFEQHPGQYLERHYDVLRRFFEEAAAQGRAVATWWD